ncbi:MAG: PEGA domain-containing protein [Phycisphaerae bacterium]|nr:PEGA domain-containing protein [Phycisphaerae bacterium]
MLFRKTDFLALALVFGAACLITGCVERKISISTEPDGALILLNDEEIGTSPVTVGFEWYGDYSVVISKDGYQTLKTHQNLPRPMSDRFPLDLFADMFSSRIDEYKWQFKLEPLQPIDKAELIKSAVSLKKEALTPPEDKKPAKKKK